MNHIISQHDNGLLYAYHLGTFWFWLADKRWVPSDFAKQEYEKAQKKNPRITPEEFMDSDDFIQMDDYEVPSQKLSALKALTPADSRMHAPDAEDVTDAPAASAEAREIVNECSEPDEECPYLQPLENSKKYNCQCSLCGDKFVNRDICNKSFRGCGWYQDQQEKDARHNDEEEIPATDSCQCRTCEHESCFAHGCTKECPANAEESCLTTSCPEYREKSQVSANPTNAAPASPADAGAAAQNLSAASPASLEAPPSGSSAFDYSGLDDQTVEDLHLAEREYIRGRKLAEVGLRRMADGVAMAHNALCGCDNLSQAHNNQHSEKTFGSWCDSVGLNRKAAERLLQVARLFDNSTPREEKVLEELGPSLLYAAAKPSAPAELVQAVKDGDITSHKQYQDLLAEIRARDAKIKDLLEMSEAADRRADAAQTERDAADTRARAAEKERDEACKERDGAKSALQASKLRGDRLKAENDDLKARPIEVPAVDEEEIDRRVNARLQQAVYASQEERRQINARNAEDAILLLGRQINTAWQMVRPFLAEMEESRRVEAIDRINREWAQTQKEIMQCL